MKKQSVSVLKALIDGDVTKLGADADSAKDNTVKYLKGCKIDMADKLKMILSIQRCETLNEIHKYIFNAYLKYSGLGVQTFR